MYLELIAIALGGISILVGIYAVWGGRGLIPAIRGINTDTSSIKQSIDEHISDLVGVVDKLIDKIPGNTIKHELKNIGKVKISISDIGVKQTIYDIVTNNTIFKKMLVDKLSKETNLNKFEEELFGEATTFRVLRPSKIRFYIPSQDKEKCNKFLVFILKWLDSEYWESFQQLNEWEQSLKKQLSPKTIS